MPYVRLHIRVYINITKEFHEQHLRIHIYYIEKSQLDSARARKIGRIVRHRLDILLLIVRRTKHGISTSSSSFRRRRRRRLLDFFRSTVDRFFVD